MKYFLHDTNARTRRCYAARERQRPNRPAAKGTRLLTSSTIMLHFIELRHNPLAVPSHTGAFVEASELIFLAAQNEYDLNHKHESQQRIACHEFRVVADDAGKRRLILSLAMLLPEGDPLMVSMKQYANTMSDEPSKAK